MKVRRNMRGRLGAEERPWGVCRAWSRRYNRRTQQQIYGPGRSNFKRYVLRKGVDVYDKLKEFLVRPTRCTNGFRGLRAGLITLHFRTTCAQPCILDYPVSVTQPQPLEQGYVSGSCGRAESRLKRSRSSLTRRMLRWSIRIASTEPKRL